jgi:hypothetical protein
MVFVGAHQQVRQHLITILMNPEQVPQEHLLLILQALMWARCIMSVLMPQMMLELSMAIR